MARGSACRCTAPSQSAGQGSGVACTPWTPGRRGGGPSGSGRTSPSAQRTDCPRRPAASASTRNTRSCAPA
eukprot:792475-Alexandrium_andersonii.AAC.1